MPDNYDVCVVGGGTAGVMAAIQAGRAGAQTLLVEKEGVLGGTMITAAINAPASFHSWDRQVIAGIGWELVCRTLEETGQPAPDPAKASPQAGSYHIPIDRAVFAALADQAVLDAGVELLLHTMPAAAAFEDDAWSLSLCTKTGLRAVRARVLVDCTGDANAVTLAGFEVERSDELQPATLVVRTGGYDADALDYDAIQAAFEQAVAAGEMKLSDPGWSGGRIEFFLRSYGGNRIHVPGVDGRTSEGKTRAEIEGRRAMLRLLRFCRRQGGLENFRIEFFATECGIRETATIRGKKTITAADYESGRVWEDAVCYGHYSIDVHRETDIFHRHLKRGCEPTIPLGAMLPAGSRNLVVAGRCMAGDREANSSYRVEATCMAAGQAAGAVAALAAQNGLDPADVPVRELRDLLARHGAIVPEAVAP